MLRNNEKTTIINIKIFYYEINLIIMMFIINKMIKNTKLNQSQYLTNIPVQALHLQNLIFLVLDRIILQLSKNIFN